ncbi:putative Uncharacterized oxidoreductase YesF [Syntrophobacter sp. SbD1]|nr:putative Uncharacterized oxidoreductase YesF [Syntrophobacter sp. SbD1]
METILVTGATGKLGSAVVEALVDRGIFVKAATRQTTKIKWTQRVQPLVFDYKDTGLYKAALDKVSGVFLIAPPLDSEAPSKMIPFIDKAGESGVKYILFISALKMELSEQNPLRMIELHLLKSGIDCTILRPNFFMENFSTGWLAPSIASGAIRLSAGEAKTSFISVEDIARAAAVCLEEKRSGQQYDLTGREALSYGEVVRILSDVCGRKVTYHTISETETMRLAREQGMPESAIQYMANLFAMVRKGLMAEITGTVRELTGKAPMSFEEFAQKNADIWKVRKAA